MSERDHSSLDYDYNFTRSSTNGSLVVAPTFGVAASLASLSREGCLPESREPMKEMPASVVDECITAGSNRKLQFNKDCLALVARSFYLSCQRNLSGLKIAVEDLTL